MENNIIAIAKETITVEAAAISNLVSYLNEDFELTVKAISQSTGRVVISGIGKSAIVGQKIVATLNSTGTPALFMHAADAVHGDLGMLLPNDIVIIISKSGESPEIKTLIPIIKNFGNTLISIVGNTNSFLATQSQYILNTTVDKEACPNNLAPTSSTTAQMVIGDALAVCLMQLKGFTNKDFATNHPGGNLGKRLYLTVNDLVSIEAVPKVMITASLKEVIVEITQKRLGVTAVVDSNNIVEGIITDGDLRRMLEKDTDFTTLTAIDIYSKNPKNILPNVLAVEALAIFSEYNISQLIVQTAEKKYVGILHIHDLIKEGIV